MALLEPETKTEMAASMAAGVNPLVGTIQDLYDVGAGAANLDPVRTIFGLGGLALTATPFSGRRARQALEEGYGLYKKNPIEDPAVREAVTRRGDEAAAGRLTVESAPKPSTPEEVDSAIQSVVRGVSDERSGDAFDYAVQRALMISETAADAASSVRRQPQFADMSDEEFADRFGSAVERVVETQRSLDAGRGIRSLTPEQQGEQRLLGALFPQQQRSVRGQGVGPVGSTPVRADGLYDVETLEAPSSVPRRSVLLSEPTPMDLEAGRIIQRRAGDIDIDEVSPLRAGDPTDKFEPVERLFDPEDVGDLRTYREQLQDRYGENIPTSLDINSILNELQDMFPDASRDELHNAVTNSLNSVSSDLAIRVGRETLEESGKDAARFLMRGVDIGRKGEISGRRRNRLAGMRAEEKAIEEARERLIRQKAYERAYAGDPLPDYDPLGQYRGAGSRTPKREYRFANPDWRKGLLTIPPNR
jgi:hypothetical protein